MVGEINMWWPIKFGIIGFAIFILFILSLEMKSKKIKVFNFIFWIILWLSVIIIALYEPLFTYIANILGIPLGTTLAVYIGMPIIFYLIFRLYAASDSQNKIITKLVREIAIRDAQKQNKESETFIKDEVQNEDKTDSQ